MPSRTFRTDSNLQYILIHKNITDTFSTSVTLVGGVEPRGALFVDISWPLTPSLAQRA